jgi:hypothetical protein
LDGDHLRSVDGAVEGAAPRAGRFVDFAWRAARRAGHAMAIECGRPGRVAARRKTEVGAGLLALLDKHGTLPLSPAFRGTKVRHTTGTQWRNLSLWELAVCAEGELPWARLRRLPHEHGPVGVNSALDMPREGGEAFPSTAACGADDPPARRRPREQARRGVSGAAGCRDGGRGGVDGGAGTATVRIRRRRVAGTYQPGPPTSPKSLSVIETFEVWQRSHSR